MAHLVESKFDISGHSSGCTSEDLSCRRGKQMWALPHQKLSFAASVGGCFFGHCICRAHQDRLDPNRISGSETVMSFDDQTQTILNKCQKSAVAHSLFLFVLGCV